MPLPPPGSGVSGGNLWRGETDTAVGARSSPSTSTPSRNLGDSSLAQASGFGFAHWQAGLPDQNSILPQNPGTPGQSQQWFHSPGLHQAIGGAFDQSSFVWKTGGIDAGIGIAPYSAATASISQPDERRGAREDFNTPYPPQAPQRPVRQALARSESTGGSGVRQGSGSSTSTVNAACPAGISNNVKQTSSPAIGGRSEGPRRRITFRENTHTPPSWDRRSEEGQTPPLNSKPSSTSRTSYREGSIKADMQEDDMIAAQKSSENGDHSARPSILRARQRDALQEGKAPLPAEKGFPIQIGSELFRLSGASIMSDGLSIASSTTASKVADKPRAPSYFSDVFQDQLSQNDEGNGGMRTLYIDRDSATFHDIARHLQGKYLSLAGLGYHIQPRDGAHYVRLFADAQFYRLQRLIKQLFDSEIFIQIGDQNFQIPRDLFSSPGDSPNFFSLGFAVFFNSPDEVFPGLDREGLLRPPSILPPSVQGRSASTFSDLLHLLRGYPLHIRNIEHRMELLRDCRYFHLRGLEQKLILHHISYNVQRQKSEIVIRLEDLRQSGVSFAGDVTPSDRSPLAGWVNYTRPFVDETSYELIVEISDESTKIDFRSMRADFHGQAKARITSLFQVVANKMNLPTNVPLGLMMSTGGVAAQPVSPGNTPLSEDRVRVLIERDAHVILDGEEHMMEHHNIDIFDNFNNGTAGEGSIDIPGFASSAQPTSGWTPTDPSAMLTQSRSPSLKAPPRKRKRRGSLDEFGEWVIRKGQWRLRVQPRPEQLDHHEQRMEIVMHAVKLDAISGQRGRNALRGFLTE